MASTHVSGLVAATTPAWATSGRHLVIPFGRILRVYDITAEPDPSCIAYLRGHSAVVVAVVNAGDMRVASASEDGTVRVWDITDGACICTIDVGCTLFHMCAIDRKCLLCFAAKKTFVVHLETGQKSRKHKARTKCLFPGAALDFGNRRLASSSDGSIVAALNNRSLYLTSRAAPHSPLVRINHHSCLTAVCVSDDGSKLAIGNEIGQIIVYPEPASLLGRSNKLVKMVQADITNSTLHWHCSAVRGLTFSKDGNHLFSGSTEATLVTWKMTPNDFGKKSFLPRLGAPILSLSLSNDGKKCALIQADNSVRIMDLVSSQITATIRGISASIAEYNPTENPDLSSKVSAQSLDALRMARHPTHTGHVLLSGVGSNLQLYDMYKGQHVADITICPRNVVHQSKARQDEQPLPATVTAAEIHPSGRIMATVEVQSLFPAEKADDLNSDQRITNLRFWDMSPDNDITMTAVFSRPHGVDKDVSSVCFHPHLPIAVTTSTCGNFKIWRSSQWKEQNRSASWRVEAELGYKSLPCSSCCFSSDGSLLAVTCGSLLTLWHIEDSLEGGETVAQDLSNFRAPALSAPSSIHFELLHALVHPPAEETLRSVRFVNGRVPLFLTATDFGIYVWNALSQGIWWSTRIRTKPDTIAVDEKSGLFGIAVQIPAAVFPADGRQDEHLNGEKEVAMEDVEDGAPLPNGVMNEDSSGAGEGLANGKQEPKTQSTGGLRKQEGDHSNEVDIAGARKLEPSSSLDSAVAVFDASSPYPLRVLQQSTGADVTCLEFVSNSSTGGRNDSTLVCIDTNFEVSFYNPSGDDDGFSVVTGASSPGIRAKSAPEPEGKLEALLGKNTGSQSERKVAHGARHRKFADSQQPHDHRNKIFRLMDDFFDGPIHIQAPVSVKAADFIRALRSSAGTASERRGDVPPVEAEAVNEPPVPAETAENPDNGTLPELDYDACFDICKDIVLKHASEGKGSRRASNEKKKSKGRLKQAT